MLYIHENKWLKYKFTDMISVWEVSLWHDDVLLQIETRLPDILLRQECNKNELIVFRERKRSILYAPTRHSPFTSPVQAAPSSFRI